MSTVIDHTHPALRRPEAPTAFQMGWEGLTDVEPPAEWPREARRAWMADWRAGHRARTAALESMARAEAAEAFQDPDLFQPEMVQEDHPDIWPSLDQINAERRISGQPEFADEQAVVAKFEELCDIARRHEAERMKALAKGKGVENDLPVLSGR